MREYTKLYIDGAWVDPAGGAQVLDVINPATEEVAGHVSAGTAADVDRAADAARRAFASWAVTTREERIDLLQRIIAEYKRREIEIADAITEEMGAPRSLALRAQTGSGLAHLEAAVAVLRNYAFAEEQGTTRIVREPIGVCGLITPWNWPLMMWAPPH
ncbi:aldehyde dehydrogenase family protein [Sphingomonas fennica]|uniref:aldehyde dehydrogenase family protein n=1 Tax=Edaphosphingomonas fennica TaxID=114404 RepID=UPI001FE752CD|nr:aldehyde dehydrogenase family protein [Sphingomonas fennica]